MRQEYRQWLEQQKYDAGTVNAQMYRAERVEENYGNLDDHYSGDRMAALINELRYSTDDERHGRPNPSKIPFTGNVRNNLASYRNAVERYRKFREVASDSNEVLPIKDVLTGSAVPIEEEASQRIGLERDLQATLRLKIDQLEQGLIITDDGAERSVDSGFIDITCRDESGKTVVIELKAGVAGQRAVAQILSYMGDISFEEQDGVVRGILIASDFDTKAKAAARMVPTLILRKYSVKFTFADGHG